MSEDQDWQRRLGERLRASESLDAVTRARLSAARARALADAARDEGSRSWIKAGALIGAAAALVAVVMLRQPSEPQPAPRLAQAETLELLLDDDSAPADPEFYEDLEVLRWLAQADEHA